MVIWWYYDLFYIHLFAKFPKCTWFMPASEIIFLGSPVPVNKILAALTRSSSVRLSAFFTMRLVLVNCNAQDYFNFNKKCQCQPPPKASIVPHMGFSSCVAVSADILSMWHTAVQCVQCLHSCSPSNLLPHQNSHLFNVCMVTVQLLQYLPLHWKMHNYSSALHGNAINHCQQISNWPVVLNTTFHFIFLCGQPYINVYF